MKPVVLYRRGDLDLPWMPVDTFTDAAEAMRLARHKGQPGLYAIRFVGDHRPEPEQETCDFAIAPRFIPKAQREPRPPTVGCREVSARG